MNVQEFKLWKELPTIEKVLEELFSCYGHDQYEYPDKDNKEKNFSSITRKHFEGKYQDLNDMLYGVYIISRKEPSKILYIGKAGTFDNEKNGFKAQDLPGRLGNRKSKILSRDGWMEKLHEEHGTLLIQYILLPDFKKNPTPAFIESLLIQAYLKENLEEEKKLPLENRKF